MCVKIVRAKETVEFDPSKPLELQARGAKQIIVDYKPEDSGVSSFMEQFERIARSGLSFSMNIKFMSNHTLAGYRAERKLDQLNEELGTNDVVTKMVEFTSLADKQLRELAEMCVRK